MSTNIVPHCAIRDEVDGSFHHRLFLFPDNALFEYAATDVVEMPLLASQGSERGSVEKFSWSGQDRLIVHSLWPLKEYLDQVIKC